MTGGEDLDFRMLGPLEVQRAGVPVALPSGRAAALLGLLLVHANEAVATERILEDLWRGDPPASAGHALQVYVSNLRKLLEPGRDRGGSNRVLVTAGRGYRLVVASGGCDAARFEALATAGRHALAQTRPSEAARLLGEALAQWRGPALAEWADEPFARAEAARLEELRLVVTESRIEAELALGRHSELVGELETLVGRHPFREHLWAQLITALYRSGRQADALRAYQRLRQGLGDELGLAPSPQLRALETAVLRHDPGLAAPPPAAPAPPPPGSPMTPSVSAPPSVIAPSEETGTLEEMRVVSAVFADLAGSTALAELLDPEDYALVVGGAVERMAAGTEAMGGTVASRMGDGILALFGIRASHEDDPERAVRAGLRIVEEIDAYGAEVARSWDVEPLTARVGIDTGPVVVGGANVQVLGDALNTAARLQGAVRPGGVLCSGTVRRLVGPLFDWGQTGWFDLKGKAEAVEATEALAARAAPGSVRGLEGRRLPLIGREAEMAAAGRSLDAVMVGTGGILVVTGEPGSGKSRLVAELRRRLDGSAAEAGLRSLWLEGRCLSWGEALAYCPFREMLREWLGAPPTAAALRTQVTLRRRLGDLFGPGEVDLAPALAAMLGLTLDTGGAAPAALPPEAMRQATFDALRSLLERLAADGPVVVALDDLHWADPTSLQVIEHLLPLTEHAAVLLILALRPERGHGSWQVREVALREWAHRARELALEPLAAAPAARMLEGLVDAGTLPPATAGELLDAAEGNPLFIEELVRSLLDTGALRPGAHGLQFDPGVTVEIPRTVENVLAGRIDRLPAAARAVLGVSAVLGRQFELELLAAVCDPGTDVDGALGQLQHVGLLEQARRWPSVEYRFHHGLAQEAAYRRLVGHRRQDLHRRAARALEGLFHDRSSELHGVLALHYERAGEPEPALVHHRMAADVARGAHALEEAARQYAAALRLIPAVSTDVARRQSPPLHFGLGAVWYHQADDRAGDELRRALDGARAAGDTATEMLALEALALAEGHVEGQPRAIARLEEALEVAERVGDHAIGIRNRLTVLLVNRLELDLALASGEAALEAARRTGDELLAARAMDGLKLVAFALGDYPELRRLTGELEDVLSRHGDRWFLMFTLAESSYAWAATGQWGEAQRRLEEAAQLSEALGDRANRPFILTLGAWLGHARGRYGPSVDSARAAVVSAREARNTQWVAWSAVNLGAMLAELGALDEAIEHLEAGRVAAERSGIRIQLFRAFGHLAHARAQSGQPGADGDLAAAEELMAGISPPPGKCFLYGLDAYLAVAMVRLARDEAEAVAARLVPLLAAAESAAWMEGVARTSLALGACARQRGHADQAMSLLTRSLEVAEAADLGPVRWQAHAALAALAHQRGADETARSHDLSARAVVDGLAGSITDPELRTVFMATVSDRLRQR